MKVKTDDPMQPGYTYETVCGIGKEFDEEFKPDLTPTQMLELGVFGGVYFEGNISEYPSSWFKDSLISDVYDKELNFFKIKASKPLEYWVEKGWINPVDPRGWFQWYCRYYYGRRIPDEDKRQIKRWKAIKRHVSQLENNCYPGDINCRPRQRQALLHWAYDSREI